MIKHHQTNLIESERLILKKGTVDDYKVIMTKDNWIKTEYKKCDANADKT